MTRLEGGEGGGGGTAQQGSIKYHGVIETLVPMHPVSRRQTNTGRGNMFTVIHQNVTLPFLQDAHVFRAVTSLAFEGQDDSERRGRITFG